MKLGVLQVRRKKEILPGSDIRKREQIASQIDFFLMNTQFFPQIESIKFHCPKGNIKKFNNLFAGSPRPDKICYLDFPWGKVEQLGREMFAEGGSNILDTRLHEIGIESSLAALDHLFEQIKIRQESIFQVFTDSLFKLFFTFFLLLQKNPQGSIGIREFPGSLMHFLLQVRIGQAQLFFSFPEIAL